MTAPQPTGATMSIGAVIDRLRGEFPDVTVSKIRFLESEGLVTPERTNSGYRRFTYTDCERLRYVLTAQRDHYLPLKVIKEQLEAADRGERPATGPTPPRQLVAVAPAEDFLVKRPARIGLEDLITRTETSREFIRELERNSLLSTGAGGFYDEDAVTLVRTAHQLTGYGIEVRHLRGFKTSADREAGLIAQIAAPVSRGKDNDAAERAQELIRELAALSVTLHTQLVKAAVRHSVK